MLRESLPSLVRGASITVITLFGYTAMAGAVGAGGIGDIAIRYGYQRYLGDVMIVSIVLCVVLVQVFQSHRRPGRPRGGQARSQVVGSCAPVGAVRAFVGCSALTKQVNSFRAAFRGGPSRMCMPFSMGDPGFAFASSMPRARNPLATCADIISL